MRFWWGTPNGVEEPHSEGGPMPDDDSTAMRADEMRALAATERGTAEMFERLAAIEPDPIQAARYRRHAEDASERATRAHDEGEP